MRCAFARTVVMLAALAAAASDAAAQAPKTLDLDGYVAGSIARCAVFTGNRMRSADELRRCYVDATKAADPSGVQILSRADNQAILGATTRAVDEIKKSAHVPEHFDWVLLHEGQLPAFRELSKKGQVDGIRATYKRLQSHNPDARNLLNALSDKDVRELVGKERLAVLIPENVGTGALQRIAASVESTTVTVPKPIPLVDLAQRFYGSSAPAYQQLVRSATQKRPIDFGSDTWEKTAFIDAPGVNVQFDQATEMVQPGTLRLPALPAPQSVAFVSLRRGVSANAASTIFASAGVPASPPTQAALVKPETNPRLASQTVNAYGSGGLQWYAASIGADRLLASDVGPHDVIHVGVVDAGVETTHPTLQDALWALPSDFPFGNWPKDSVGWDYPRSTADPRDEASDSHGTHVTGLVTGRQLARWLPELRALDLSHLINVYSLKVIDNSPYLEYAIAADAIVDGMNNGLKLFNVSIEGAQYSLLWGAVKQQQQHALLVVAAGNSTLDLDTPSNLKYNGSFRDASGKSLPNTILVAALKDTGDLTGQSNRGKASVDIAAPGGNISSTIRGNAFGELTGTSQAAPLVTFAAAILAAEHPSAFPSQVKNRVLATCEWEPALAAKVTSGCALNVTKAVIATTDLIELNDQARTWVRGTVRRDQFHLSDGRRNPVNVDVIQRIAIGGPGGAVRVSTTVDYTPQAVTGLSASIQVELPQSAKCPQTSEGMMCSIDSSRVRDIVFRSR